MPIAVNCGCGKQFRVPDEYAGKKIKCTSCGETRIVAAGAKNGTAKSPTAQATLPAQAAKAAVLKFQCDQCDRPMQAKAEYAGKKTKCPGCQAIVTIPSPEDEPEAAEVVEEEETPRARIQAGKTQTKKAAKAPVEEDEAEEIEEIEEAEEEEAEEVEEEEERPKGRIQSSKSLKKASSKRPADEEDEVEDAEEIEEIDEDEDDEDEDDQPRKGKKSLKKKRSRMPLLIGLSAGALLLLVGGVVALVMLLGGSGGSDLAMIPSDAQLFAVVRVKDLWKEPLVQEAVRQANKKAGEDIAAGFQKEMGIPPDEIERLTFVNMDSSGDKSWVVITTTKAIDKAQSIDKMKLDPTEIKHEGKAYLKTKGMPTAVHFASSNMLLVTPNEGSMKMALEQLTGSRKASGKLGNAISLAGKHHVVVGFVIPPEMAKMAKMAGGPKPGGGGMGGFGPDFTPLLEMQSGAVTVNLNGNTLQHETTGDFPDAAKATKAKDMLDLLKKSIPAFAAFLDKETADQLQAMTINTSGNAVILKGSIAFKNEDIPKLLNGMPMLGMEDARRLKRPEPGPKPGNNPGGGRPKQR